MRVPRMTALFGIVVAAELPMPVSAQSFTVNQGNIVHVVLEQDVHTKTIKVGDRIQASCPQDSGGFPAGTKFFGIVQAVKAADSKTSGSLTVLFATAVLKDKTEVSIAGEPVAGTVQGKTTETKGTKKRNAVIGAAAGGLIGQNFLGVAVGARIGAATGKKKSTQTTDLQFKAGTPFDIRMLKTVTVTRKPSK